MNFIDLYKQKLLTSAQLAELFEPDWKCCSDVAVSVPQMIYKALGVRARNGGIVNVTMNTFLDVVDIDCYDKNLSDKLHGVSWFSGASARKAVNGGYADFMPVSYNDMPRIIREYSDIDVFCVAVSPMDKHGYFSMGCSGSNTFAMMRKSKRIFLEVNSNMPRSLSAPIIHISQVDALCETDIPLPTLPIVEPDETSIAIASYIAEEVADGATIQLGIGSIPNAVVSALKNKKELGIHTEMLTDGMIELLECGVVTNTRKPIHVGRTVTTFALGSKHMYEYIDDNPAIEMLPVEYVNNPTVIAKHPNFVSVNAALEVDFYGQVCAESVGTRHISGTGGQIDYVRGAIASKGGKSFIAFPSTAKNETISKIAPTLTPGAIVTTGKNDVDCIVTEYGIAKLRGQSLANRTKALIAIAHPKFREELSFQAKKQNILI